MRTHHDVDERLSRLLLVRLLAECRLVAPGSGGAPAPAPSPARPSARAARPRPRRRARPRRTAPADSPSFFNFATLTAFLAWFGGAGYLLTRYADVWPLAALLAADRRRAAPARRSCSAFMAKVLWSPHENLDPDDYDLVGLLGVVSSPIRAGGIGEMLFSQAGARRVRRRAQRRWARRSRRASKSSSRGMKTGSSTCARGRNCAAQYDDERATSRRRRQYPGGAEWASRPASVVTVALMALTVIFLTSIMATLYRKAGPHEALVVYGFRGTRVVKGHGTVIFPMIEACRAAVARADVVRRRADAGPLHQAGRRGHRRGGRADQGEVGSRVDSDRVRAVPDQVARPARGPDPPGDGRAPARHHRPADGRADRQGAGDGRRPHARPPAPTT